MEDSIVHKTPQVSAIKRERGEKSTLAYIKMWILDLQMSLNIKNKLNEDMVDLCAQMILDDFWYCTIGDLKNIITWAKMGRYGEFYESISIPKIISWFDEYLNDKLNRCAEISRNKHYYNQQEELGWKDRVRDNLTDVEKALLKKK